MNPILEFKDLSYSYHTVNGELCALKDISFSVLPGEFVSIVGPSGCGKSTLLSLVTGLMTPQTGTIIKDTNASIGYMLQRDNLFEWRTIYQNILLGLEIQKKKTSENLIYVERLIYNYGLSQFKNVHPSELSGGMRQRAALIRTLVLKPDILLLDEPFSALDYKTRLEVSDDIGRILKAENKTAILVTHDISEAISMGDTVIVMTSRPATIKKIIPVNVSISERTPFKTRFAPEFKEIFNDVWEEMNAVE
ncbi:MAG: ABC transporter ATP-binding protein [Lachnospiraceae bacterium]